VSDVMVCRVRDDAVFVSVPIVMNGDRMTCVFFRRKAGLARIGIFLDKSIEVGPFFVLENYKRRLVPASVIVEARERAEAALDELESQSERASECEMYLAFSADVASPN
jgi:hypothetical protein